MPSTRTTRSAGTAPAPIEPSSIGQRKAASSLTGIFSDAFTNDVLANGQHPTLTWVASNLATDPSEALTGLFETARALSLAGTAEGASVVEASPSLVKHAQTALYEAQRLFDRLPGGDDAENRQVAREIALIKGDLLKDAIAHLPPTYDQPSASGRTRRSAAAPDDKVAIMKSKLQSELTQQTLTDDDFHIFLGASMCGGGWLEALMSINLMLKYPIEEYASRHARYLAAEELSPAVGTAENK